MLEAGTGFRVDATQLSFRHQVGKSAAPRGICNPRVTGDALLC